VPNPSIRTILDHVRRTIGATEFADWSDNSVLQRALDRRDPGADAAFAVLVHRHGSLVYRTCYAALRNVHDADDAFQATFLVLARKAKSLRHTRYIGPWLYEVARRISLHARTAATRRSRHERLAAEIRNEIDGRNERALAALHEVLGRLPSRFRLPIVLCDLEELSYRDAAVRIGCTESAIRNRLARGRRRLSVAMRRLGFDPASSLTVYGALPAVPTTLIHTTATAAVQVLSGCIAGAIPVSVLALTHEGLQTMLLIKLKTAGLAAIATAVLITGAYGLSGQVRKEKSSPDDPPKPASTQAATPNPRPPLKTAALIAKLAEPLTIEHSIADAPLKDVLEFLQEKQGVRFIVDDSAFEQIGKKAVREEKINLQKIRNVSLDTVLRYVLAQVSGAVMVRNNYLEITTRDQSILESRNNVFMSHPHDVQPLVNVDCVAQPLTEVLANLARQSGRNIVLDTRVKDRDQLQVSVTLLNTPLNTAVRVIAELMRLKTVPMDNVILVTTPDHAAELLDEEKAEAEKRKMATVGGTAASSTKQ
jgi:RNA polymerase sigma factor (sigma-70 family)